MGIENRDWYRGEHPPTCTCSQCARDRQPLDTHSSNCTCVVCCRSRNSTSKGSGTKPSDSNQNLHSQLPKAEESKLYPPGWGKLSTDANTIKLKPKRPHYYRKRHHVRNIILILLVLALTFCGLALIGVQPFADYGQKAKLGLDQVLATAKQGIEKAIAWGNGTSEESINSRVQALYEATNQKRIKNGMQPFTRNVTLEQLAQSQAESMHNRGTVDHLGFDSRSTTANRAGFDMTAENCAGGGYEASSFIDMWMDSAGHRANILNPRLTHIGIGIYGKYAVQDFGG